MNRKRQFAIIMICILLLPVITPLFPKNVQAVAGQPISISFPGTQMEGVTYSGSPTLNHISVGIGAAGKTIERWEVIINDTNLGQIGTLSGGTLTLSAVAGQAHTVANIVSRNPGHHVWRNAAGTHWQAKRSSGPTYQFPGGCVENGISECPGRYPSHLPADLQNNGMAVTYVTDVVPPSTFHINPADIGNDQEPRIPVSSTQPSSIKIIQGKSKGITEGVEIIAAGAGQLGFGMIRVGKLLDNEEDVLYDPLSATGPTTGETQGRNYAMAVNTYWEATTYIYKGEVTVYYQGDDDEFLGLRIDPTYKQITVGQTQPFTVYARWRQAGQEREYVVDHSRLAWSSADSSRVAVNSSGVATGVAVTTTNVPITARFIERNTSVSATVSVVASTEPVHVVTGQFEFVPSHTYDWRDTITIRPKNFVLSTGCTYQSHQYRFERDGISSTSAVMTSRTADTVIPYSQYPSSLGVGVQEVSLRITASCMTTNWLDHQPLVINGPENNRPPKFSVGWTTPGRWTQADVRTSVVVGTQLDLVYLDSPAPLDPDGDALYFQGFDFASSAPWAKDIPAHYTEQANGYHRIVMDTPGTYCAVGVMRDAFGLDARRTACVEVVAANPIPVITGPTEVVEGRPLAQPLSSAGSYSPIGRTIDHTRDIWVNRKDVYNTPGTEVVTLHVVDSAGLPSLEPARHTITVKPDEPPVAMFTLMPMGIRDDAYDIWNNSFSIDGDTIISAEYRYKYDNDRDGFDDDAWITLTGDLTKAILQPHRVGEHLIELCVTEDYGKSACVWQLFDVVNVAPSVLFVIEGKHEEPQPSQSVVHTASAMRNWSLYDTNSLTVLRNKPHMWTTENGKLLAGLGKGMEQQFAYSLSMTYANNQSEAYRVFPMFSDNGYGPNSVSPYRALATRDVSRSQPILIPNTYQPGETYTRLEPAQFGTMIRTNVTHVLFDQTRNQSYSDGTFAVPYVFGFNKSKVPRYEAYDDAQTSGSSYQMELRYRWLDPNPYDYIIRIVDDAPISYYTDSDKSRDRDWQSKAQAGDFSGASSTATPLRPNLPKLEASGSRIFAVYDTGATHDYAYQNCCDNGGWSYRSYQYNSQRYIDIHIYDAATGELLERTYQRGDRIPLPAGNPYRLVVKGEHLVVLFGQATNRYMEFDRSGNLVASGSVPLSNRTVTHTLKSRNQFGQVVTGVAAMYACNWQSDSNPVWKDDTGNLYMYKYNRCYVNGSQVNYDVSLNPELPGGIYLVQIKPDYTLGIVQKLRGDDTHHADRGFYDFKKEVAPVLFVNPVTSEVVTRTYASVGCSGCQFQSVTEYADVVNVQQGTIGTWGRGKLAQFTENFSPGFYVGHTGYYGTGWKTASASGTFDKFDWHAGKTIKMNAANYVQNRSNTTQLRFGEYVGDGMWLSIYGGAVRNTGQGVSSSYTDQSAYMFLDTGTPHTTQAYKGFQLGQLVSPSAAGNAEFAWSMAMQQPTADNELAGLSFRMTDPRNRYAVEANGTTLFLSKYVNGSRTVLRSIGMTMQPNVSYAFRVKVTGSRIELLVNGVPFFDVTDSTFASGTFGPFSDKSYVTFSEVRQTEVTDPNVHWLSNYAIWEEDTAIADVRVSGIMYSDPEDDPQAGAHRWTVTHTPKFLNNQGVSALHEQTFTTAVVALDKVGSYRVTLRAQDDPHPDYRYPSAVYDDYRKWSNEYWQLITAHRRPVAVYTLSLDAQGYVNWTDTSYDPDRWASASQYSTEATGIDYAATRGVLERRYYYVSPSGMRVSSRLVAPTEAGTYAVGLQVRDEYGAWSNWNEQTLTITTPVAKDDPPTAGFTVSPITVYRGQTLAVTSTASDKEDGAAANLAHAYYVRNVTTEGDVEALRSTNRGTWNTMFSSLGVMEIRQMVTDSKGQTAQMVRQVTVVNRAPAAAFDWTPKPVWEGDTVRLINQSTDADLDVLAYRWHIVTPDGSVIESGSSQWQGKLQIAGEYTVTLTAHDGIEQHSIKRVIHAEPLHLVADVRHMPGWLAHHESKGHQVSKPPKQFYSGEAMVVHAFVAPRPVRSVDAWLDTIGADGRDIHASVRLEPVESGIGYEELNEYTGRLYDESFSSVQGGIPLGLEAVHVKVEYENGVVKQERIQIEIIGHVHETVNVHRQY